MNTEQFYDDLGEGYLETFKSESMAKVLRTETDMVLSHMPDLPKQAERAGDRDRARSNSRRSGEEKRLLYWRRSSQTMVQACQRRIGPGHVLIHHDVSKGLPFPDETFDYIYSIRVLKYVHDLPGLLQDAYRVLTPGGTFLFGMPNQLSINALQLRQHATYHRYSIKMVKEMLERAGFRRWGSSADPNSRMSFIKEIARKCSTWSFNRKGTGQIHRMETYKESRSTSAVSPSQREGAQNNKDWSDIRFRP